MKKFRKPFKFYLMMFLFITIALVLYSLYRIIFDKVPISELYMLWVLPVFFVVIYAGSDFLLDKIFNRKKKVNKEDGFLEAIGNDMRNSKQFIIEDFRKLQMNDKFQKSLNIAFKIYKDGEDEVFTIDKLRKKFDKGTLEHKAMFFVVKYLEENPSNDGKN